GARPALHAVRPVRGAGRRCYGVRPGCAASGRVPAGAARHRDRRTARHQGEDTMSRARTVVFGASHWHVPLYVGAMAEHHDGVAVGARARAGARAAADALGGVPVREHAEVLDADGLELAYVFGPHDEMPELCLALVERGVPFVVEKPLGT